MKNLLFHLFFFLTFLCSNSALAQNIPDRPNPPRLVNDLANLMTPDEAQRLESELVSYDDSTSSQITVVTVPTIGDTPIEDYALEIGRKWGVGRKGKNNGVVIVVSAQPHKVNISTGYGMEGVLPDAVVKRMIVEKIGPAFRQGQYYAGLHATAQEIAQRAKGEYINENPGNGSGGGDGGFWTFIIILVVIFILITIFSNRRGGSYSSRGGMFGGPWIFPTGGGGGWGGGHDSGGGGGGFGGFGGGDFGGGGASGDW